MMGHPFALSIFLNRIGLIHLGHVTVNSLRAVDTGFSDPVPVKGLKAR
jgi:hypothetical protein